MISAICSNPPEVISYQKARFRRFPRRRVRLTSALPLEPVVPRERANHDVNDAVTGYLSEDADAFGFVDALEDAYVLLGRHPPISATRYAYDFDIGGPAKLAAVSLPYVILYIEQE